MHAYMHSHGLALQYITLPWAWLSMILLLNILNIAQAGS